MWVGSKADSTYVHVEGILAGSFVDAIEAAAMLKWMLAIWNTFLTFWSIQCIFCLVIFLGLKPMALPQP